MDFLKNVGNMVGKGFDSLKTNIIKNQDNPNSNLPNNSLPKGVHILGIEDQPNQQTNNYNQVNNKNANSKENEYNKYYYGQPISYESQTQPKAQSSSIRDLFNINQQPKQTSFPQAKGNTPDKDFIQGFNFINGEKPVEWERCLLKLEKGAYPCKVLLTGYRINIIPNLDQSYNNHFPEGYFSLPIHKIEKTNRIPKPETFEFFYEIIMNDARIFPLIFKTGINETFSHMLNNLFLAKETPSYSQLTYDYNKDNPIYKKENFQDGWKLYDPEKKYQRHPI